MTTISILIVILIVAVAYGKEGLENLRKQVIGFGGCLLYLVFLVAIGIGIRGLATNFGNGYKEQTKPKSEYQIRIDKCTGELGKDKQDCHNIYFGFPNKY